MLFKVLSSIGQSSELMLGYVPLQTIHTREIVPGNAVPATYGNPFNLGSGGRTGVLMGNASTIIAWSAGRALPSPNETFDPKMEVAFVATCASAEVTIEDREEVIFFIDGIALDETSTFATGQYKETVTKWPGYRIRLRYQILFLVLMRLFNLESRFVRRAKQEWSLSEVSSRTPSNIMSWRRFITNW